MGGELKDTILWLPPNDGATNGTGFSAKPNGLRLFGGFFSGIGSTACI